MTAEVNVPDEAVKLAAEQIRTVAAACCQEAALAANVAGSTEDWMGEAQAALKAAAPLIAAAELERLAEALPMPNHWDAAYQAGRYDAHQLLVNRAAELRGESR